MVRERGQRATIFLKMHRTVAGGGILLVFDKGVKMIEIPREVVTRHIAEIPL